MMFEFSMYFLSFLPLWLSIIMIDVFSIIRNNNNLLIEFISIPVIIGGVLICSIIVYGWIKKKGFQNRETYELRMAKEERFLTADFIMAYVLPLFAFDFTRYDGVALFLLFFIILWILVYRHKYFCTNLVLEICKFRIYECELYTDGQTISKRVVSRKELDGLCGKRMRTKKFNNDYHFEVEIL